MEDIIPLEGEQFNRVVEFMGVWFYQSSVTHKFYWPDETEQFVGPFDNLKEAKEALLKYLPSLYQ